MMNMESEIFQRILKKLFTKKIVAINIHDAIVVLDVPENEGIKSEEINNIIVNILAKLGFLKRLIFHLFFILP